MHRRSRLVLASAAAALLGFSLTACTPASAPNGSTKPSPTTSPVDSPSATPTPEVRVVQISVDGVSVDGAPAVAYRDTDGMIAALTDVFGAAPTEGTVDGPYSVVYSGFDWDGAKATADETSVWVEISADAPGVTFRTPEGIGIGSTRAEAMAAGAEDEWDEDGDGIADYLMIGMREVPNTVSLTHPGEVGVEYITLKITDDTVTRLNSGGNDFSDI
jgi:ABC-type amino acid transport substrate-binding protein